MLEHLIDQEVIFKHGKTNFGICKLLSIKPDTKNRTHSNKKTWIAVILREEKKIELVCWETSSDDQGTKIFSPDNKLLHTF